MGQSLQDYTKQTLQELGYAGESAPDLLRNYYVTNIPVADDNSLSLDDLAKLFFLTQLGGPNGVLEDLDILSLEYQFYTVVLGLVGNSVFDLRRQFSYILTAITGGSPSNITHYTSTPETVEDTVILNAANEACGYSPWYVCSSTPYPFDGQRYLYTEFTVMDITGWTSGGIAFGFIGGKESASLDAEVGDIAASVNGGVVGTYFNVVSPRCWIVHNPAGSGTSPSKYTTTLTAGDVVGVALDCLLGKVWVNVNGSWMEDLSTSEGGDPLTGLGWDIVNWNTSYNIVLGGVAVGTTSGVYVGSHTVKFNTDPLYLPAGYFNIGYGNENIPSTTVSLNPINATFGADGPGNWAYDSALNAYYNNGDCSSIPLVVVDPTTEKEFYNAVASGLRLLYGEFKVYEWVDQTTNTIGIGATSLSGIPQPLDTGPQVQWNQTAVPAKSIAVRNTWNATTLGTAQTPQHFIKPGCIIGIAWNLSTLRVFMHVNGTYSSTSGAPVSGAGASITGSASGRMFFPAALTLATTSATPNTMKVGPVACTRIPPGYIAIT